MNLTKHTLCTHVRPEVSGLHIRLNLTVVKLINGSPGVGWFFPPRLPSGFPFFPLQVIRSVVEIRPNFSSLVSASIRLFSEHFVADLPSSSSSTSWSSIRLRSPLLGMVGLE